MKNKKTFKNFIKQFKLKNFYYFIGKLITFIAIYSITLILFYNIGIYVLDNCITVYR